MTRFWNELAAGPIDAFGLLLVLFLLFAAAGLIGAAWQWFPAWVPRAVPFRGLFRGASWRWRFWRGGFWRRLAWSWKRPRWRWRPRWRRRTADAASVGNTDELPDLPVEVFRSNADALAAQGRYAEAVRERLRGLVRALVDAGVIIAYPGWTVTELARAAAAARAGLAQPLDGATGVFSDIWYGERPAYASHDDEMRRYAHDVDAVLQSTPAGAAR